MAKYARPLPIFSGCFFKSYKAQKPKAKETGAGNNRIEKSPIYPARIANPERPIGMIYFKASVFVSAIDEVFWLISG